MSYIRVALLLGLLTGILVTVGYLLAGVSGMTIFLIIAAIMNFLAYWFSDKIILTMYKAKLIQKSDEPKLHEMVEKLAKEMEIPKPKLYIVDMPVPNAFATGRSPKHAAVAVTASLMKSLNWGEIEGVISHELSHVINRDTLTSAISATIAGTIAYIAQMAWWGLFAGNDRRQGGSAILLPLIILAPLAAMLVQLAISRNREYAADRTGALVSKNPLSLASALDKISKVANQHPLKGNSATSQLFIVNPFKGDGFTSLFLTHPPVEKRIAKLKELSRELK